MLAKIVSFLRCNIYIGTIVTNFVIQKIFSSVKRLVIEIMLFSIFIQSSNHHFLRSMILIVKFPSNRSENSYPRRSYLASLNGKAMEIQLSTFPPNLNDLYWRPSLNFQCTRLKLRKPKIVLMNENITRNFKMKEIYLILCHQYAIKENKICDLIFLVRI